MTEQQTTLMRRSLLGRILAGGGALLAAASARAQTPAAPPAAGAASPAAGGPPRVAFRRLGVVVSDMDRSLKFYSEAFGFKIDPRPMPISGQDVANLMEVPGIQSMIRLLDTGSFPLELFTYSSPGVVGDGKRRPMNGLGICHMALTVTDMNATLAAVRAAGGTVLEHARLGPPESPRAIQVLDPDGTRIELVVGAV